MNSLSIEDDIFFMQPNSSTLEGLFGPVTFNNSESSDLTYVAPKQPKSAQKQKLANPPVKKTTVAFVKVVQVFKCVDDSYKLVGKYGIALTSDTTKLVEILLYKDKQNILTRATLSNTQIYLENNYINFNDKNNEKWYVQFDEEKHLKEFLEELTKANIKFIEVVKEKLKDTTADATTTNNNILNSDSDIETSSISQTRTDILSRVAKMGQSILPSNLKSESNDADNTYLSSPKNVRKCSSESKIFDNPKEINYTLLNENKRNNNISNRNPESPLIMSNSLTPVFPYVQGYPQNASVVNSMFPSQEFNMLVSENRIQNSEVRMNLTALSSKLDTVLSEISKIKESPNTDKLENEFLKSKVIDLERQINDLTMKLSEINQIASELNLLMTNRNEEIEKEKQNVLELQNALKSKEDLETQIDAFKLKESELNILIGDLQKQLEDSKETTKGNNIKFIKLQEINEALMKDIENINDKLKSLTTKSGTYEEKNSQENIEREVNSLSNILKESMNVMYQNIMIQHEKSNEPLQQNQLKMILTSNIKQATFNVIERYRSSLKAADDFDSANAKGSK